MTRARLRERRNSVAYVDDNRPAESPEYHLGLICKALPGIVCFAVVITLGELFLQSHRPPSPLLPALKCLDLPLGTTCWARNCSAVPKMRPHRRWVGRTSDLTCVFQVMKHTPVTVEGVGVHIATTNCRTIVHPNLDNGQSAYDVHITTYLRTYDYRPSTQNTIYLWNRGMLVVAVIMCVTSVLICRMILPRFCSGEFFTFCLSFF